MEEDASETHIGKGIVDAFKKGGIGAVNDLVQSNLDQWKSATVSIAIIGYTGVGKSTFINVFRNVKDDHWCAAKTGLTETTDEVESYQDPSNPNIQLFDVPGVGTKRFPKDKYLERIQVDRFDTFLLMTATRFAETDAWLVEELKKRGKPFFFVRTKVWIDVINKNTNVSVITPEETIIDEIRTHCRTETEIEDAKIFLIDSFNKRSEKLDFTKLCIAMTVSLPDQKKQALFDAFRDFTMFTPTLIKKKGEMLRKRIWKAAFLSGTGGLIPLPGVSLLVDIGIVSKEMNFFADQLGLRGSITEGGGISASEKVRRKIKQIEEFLSKGAADALKTLLISTGVEEATMLLPVIGAVIAAFVSFTGTKLALNRLLDEMIKHALEINELIANDIANGLSV